jgi:hypothetical protein
MWKSRSPLVRAARLRSASLALGGVSFVHAHAADLELDGRISFYGPTGAMLAPAGGSDSLRRFTAKEFEARANATRLPPHALASGAAGTVHAGVDEFAIGALVAGVLGGELSAGFGIARRADAAFEIAVESGLTVRLLAAGSRRRCGRCAAVCVSAGSTAAGAFAPGTPAAGALAPASGPARTSRAFTILRRPSAQTGFLGLVFAEALLVVERILLFEVTADREAAHENK